MTAERPLASTSSTLSRPHDGRVIAGVAAGIADYLGVDPTLVRLAFAVLTLVGGAGIPLYLAGWLLMPEAGRPSIAAEWLGGGFSRSRPPGEEEQ